MKDPGIFRNKALFKHFGYWLISFLIIYLLSCFPSFVELIYYKGIYPLIAISNRWFFSFFSFSIGDILYVIVLLYLLFLFFKLILQYKNIKTNFLSLSRFLLLIVWLFYLSWGFNYFRPKLSDTLKLNAKDYQLNELIKLGEIMKDSANFYHSRLSRNDTLPVVVTYGVEHILRNTPMGYKKISGYLGQSYRFPVIKTSLLSKMISYLHVTGYLNPFTGEAQVNKYYPKFALPFVASHEVAHQMGYAPEDEANFLGFISAVNNPDPYFKYSGYSAALYYVLIELKKYAPEEYKKIMKELHKGIIYNYKEEYRFYKQHQTNYDTSKIYDSYLKLNKQKAGIKSYNEMLRLLVSYYKKELPLIKDNY